MGRGTVQDHDCSEGRLILSLKQIAMDSKFKKPCRLCGLSKPLVESHILPEFVYRPTYDSTHTAVRIDLDKKSVRKQQTGFSEYLLCEDCESIFSRWEVYFSKIWFKPKSRLRPDYLDDRLVEIPGIDYIKFKLFHLSIIWRSGVSSRTEFRSVNLGAQERIIRKHLLASDPGEPDKYAMFCIALRDKDTRKFQDSFIRAPEGGHFRGHHVYRIIFGGVIWNYWISGHKDKMKTETNCIDRKGILRLAVQDWTDSILVKDLAKHFQMIKKG